MGERMHRREFLLAATAVLATARARPASAAPEAELWPRWQAHDPQATDRIDHAAWADVLKRHVMARPGAVNLVDYAGVTPADRDRLRRYVDAMAAVRIDAYARPEQFAYWVNLYNALTVDIVLDHWPVDSIRDIDISPGWFADGPWGKEVIEVMGKPLTLDDIEHRILRPIWRDPRVHYAVNCASIGCPDLRPEPFRGERLDPQLDAAARAYVNHPRGAQVREGRLVVSSIYEWFKADFGGDDASVIAHLKRYAAPELRAKLATVDRIADDRYDWSINAPARGANTG